MLKDLNMSQKTRQALIKGMNDQANQYESYAIQKSFNLTSFAYWSLPTIGMTIAICMVLSVHSPYSIILGIMCGITVGTTAILFKYTVSEDHKKAIEITTLLSDINSIEHIDNNYVKQPI